jgi:hypothetical protein
MIAVTTFLDALSVFAVASLTGLVGVVAVRIALQARWKRKMEAEARAGVEDLRFVSASIREFTRSEQRGGADLELFLLAALLERGTVDVSRLAPIVRFLTSDDEIAGRLPDQIAALKDEIARNESRAFVITRRHGWYDSSATPKGAVEKLAQTRRRLGAVSVSALEHVLRAEEVLYSKPNGPQGATKYWTTLKEPEFTSAVHVRAYLQRCDLIDMAVLAPLSAVTTRSAFR